MDYTNKALGLRTQTQIPLNVKEYIESESVLKDLGPGNNLAFIYEKGLIIYCILEGTRYEWKEVDISDIGLLPTNFTYPDNHIIFGIDYSNKEYNFVSTENPVQGLQDVIQTNGELTLTNLVKIAPEKSLIFYKQGGNGALVQIGGSNAIEPYFGRLYLGIGDEYVQPYVGLIFFDTSTVFKDDRDSKGIVYDDDYEANFTARSLITKQFAEAIIDDLDIQKEILSNYLLINADHKSTIFINNGATPITITLPDTITQEGFYVGFIQEGAGDVTFVTSGGITLTNPIGLKSKGQGYQTFIERKLTTTTYYLLGNTKI